MLFCKYTIDLKLYLLNSLFIVNWHKFSTLKGDLLVFYFVALEAHWAYMPFKKKGRV